MFEITVQAESLIDYLYYSVPHSKGANAYDYINDIAERLWEDRFEDQVDEDEDGCAFVQLFDSEKGDFVNIELYSISDFEKLITGIRLVDFSQEIDK